ncbi:hypothetical protein [Streptomyces sp. WM6372]|uniref:hypothetical protein n=1 Tax=Streptomyces sp. WM6372 TaxID=1415555 RepID=UPI0006B00298|nr:hypothetical protein [Streptomyces sp. WM6372]
MTTSADTSRAGTSRAGTKAAPAMLHSLGLTRIRLLTNDPDNVRELRAHAIEITEVIPTGAYVTAENSRYPSAKAELSGHTIALLQEAAA